MCILDYHVGHCKTFIHILFNYIYYFSFMDFVLFPFLFWINKPYSFHWYKSQVQIQTLGHIFLLDLWSKFFCFSWQHIHWILSISKLISLILVFDHKLAFGHLKFRNLSKKIFPCKFKG